MTMSTRRYRLYVVLGLSVAVSLAVLAYAISGVCAAAPQDSSAAMPHGPGDFRSVFLFNPLKGLEKGDGDVHAKLPPISEGYWPCSECHKPKKDNFNRRVLIKDHEKIELHHGEERWCFDCHDRNNRDRLHLASGELIEFEESSRLCGQCHGSVYQDWQAGGHGQRTGYWNGRKRYLLCVNCHWPHSPSFQPLEPLPPPVRPEFVGLGLLRGSIPEAERPAGPGSAGEGAKTDEQTKEGAKK